MNDGSSNASRKYTREIEHDARSERRLIPQAVIALCVVVALAIVRELLVR